MILPEVHVDVASVGTAAKDAVEFQRRVLKHTDDRVDAALGRREVLVPWMGLHHKTAT